MMKQKTEEEKNEWEIAKQRFLRALYFTISWLKQSLVKPIYLWILDDVSSVERHVIFCRLLFMQ